MDESQSYLARTRYCDSTDPAIARAVSSVSEGLVDDRQRAVALFRFVRDSVLYTFGPWSVRASRTLWQRQGTCTNKNNLLVAMLRQAGIPAAYGILRVDPLQYFGNLTPIFLRNLRTIEPHSASTHVYAAAHLDGRWIACDASTDSEVSSKTAHFCRQTRLIDWDGTCDALDALDPEHIHEDFGLRPSIDDLLDKSPRNAIPAKLDILNDYVLFIRREPAFSSAEALIEAYLASRGVPRSGPP